MGKTSILGSRISRIHTLFIGLPDHTVAAGFGTYSKVVAVARTVVIKNRAVAANRILVAVCQTVVLHGQNGKPEMKPGKSTNHTVNDTNRISS